MKLQSLKGRFATYMKQSSLAETLRVLRARQDLTITEACSRIGITRETLRDLEHGTRNPYYPTLEKIARAYGVTVEELMLPAHEEEPVEALSGKDEAPEESGPPLVKDSAAHMKFRLSIEAHAVRVVIRDALRRVSAGEDPVVVEREAMRKILEAA